MLEPLLSALQTEGFGWLAIAATLAGFVRGFSGFGSAMIIMPVASSILSPVEAVTFLVAVEILGPLPTMPRAWRDGQPKDIALMIGGAILALPLGLWLLTQLSPDVFNWAISIIVILLLLLIIAGWRFRGTFTRPLKLATGGVSGFMTGFSGIPGPPVIMLYMASALPIHAIRANITMHLLAVDIILFPLLAIMGLLAWEVLLLGLLAGAPYLFANMLGARLFDPGAERLFRRVAYGVIIIAALLGLPIWETAPCA